MEEVEANPLLGPFVTVNFNIRLGPAVSPFLNVGVEQVVEALGVELGTQFVQVLFNGFLTIEVPGSNNDRPLFKVNFLARSNGASKGVVSILIVSAVTHVVQVGLGSRLHANSELWRSEVVLLRHGSQFSVFALGTLAQNVPKLFVVVSVFVVNVGVNHAGDFNLRIAVTTVLDVEPLTN